MEEKSELMMAAERLKEHLVYHLSGQWAMDGVDMSKDPWEWVRQSDAELGTRCRIFKSLFVVAAGAEERENAVCIFKPQLDRFLGKYGAKFPELKKFSEEISV